MSNGTSIAELQEALAECLKGFGAFASPFRQANLEEIQLDDLFNSWKQYYLNEFARWDRLLLAGIQSRVQLIDRLLPLSISTHNLHRLMEVLSRELGQKPLKNTRVPERVLDLVTMVDRMHALLQSTSEELHGNHERNKRER